MPESSIHTNLVILLTKWITELLLSEDIPHMLVDTPDTPPQKKPPKLYDFIPDVFVHSCKSYEFIIGEAKTAADIDNNHTMEQITAFLKKCAESNNSLLILAVPWHKVRLATSVMKYCKKIAKLDNVNTTVIDHLSG